LIFSPVVIWFRMEVILSSRVCPTSTDGKRAQKSDKGIRNARFLMGFGLNLPKKLMHGPLPAVQERPPAQRGMLRPFHGLI
jgi:hypothetical protein